MERKDLEDKIENSKAKMREFKEKRDAADKDHRLMLKERMD